jgi:hypothetical protein
VPPPAAPPWKHRSTSRPPSIHRRRRRRAPTPAAAAPWRTDGGGLMPHQWRDRVQRPAASGDGDSSRPRLLRRRRFHPTSALSSPSSHPTGSGAWKGLLVPPPPPFTGGGGQASTADLMVAPFLWAGGWGSRYSALSPVIVGGQIHVRTDGGDFLIQFEFECSSPYGLLGTKISDPSLTPEIVLIGSEVFHLSIPKFIFFL